MDADSKEKRRGWGLQPPRVVERHDRFSMDPQRFDEILAEITTGYSNIRSSFENVNIAEILEEMVTEYARAALESGAPAPKFAELAVLLQHCAALYGRKVDFLYQHAVDVCDALAAPQAGSGGEGGAPAAKRRRRASGGAAGFEHIALAACGGAGRAREPPRPPPTLPRMYIELEPRAPAPHLAPLRDAAGEPVGLPQDYRVAGRLLDGWLLEELEAAGEARAPLRPLSLLELQEALVAAAPPDPPPEPEPSGAEPEPDPSAPEPGPSPAEPAPSPVEPEPSDAEPATAALARRKRRSSVHLVDIVDSPLKAFITKEVMALAARRREFCPPAAWVARVVRRRARRLLLARAQLPPHDGEFRGFEDTHPDAGGFPGWSSAEGGAARARLAAGSTRPETESDDDGFFEAESLSSLDLSSSSTPPPARAPPAPDAWSARVAARAVADEARGGVDVRALAASVLAALPPAEPLPFAGLLRRAAAARRDVSRLLLATLFLANSGNVEIGDAAPLSLGDFSVTLRSTDERRYAAAAAAEAGLHAAPAPGPGPA